uniref:ANK_REP_REGION domain-containing protein n=1 Tax=Bursaphelenchus xylophilus TaxID=6326 RepID=A0A1I7S6T4_BURXY
MVHGEDRGARDLHDLFNKHIFQAIQQAEQVINSLPRRMNIRPRSRSVSSQTDSDTTLCSRGIVPDEYSYNSPKRCSSPWNSPVVCRDKSHKRKTRRSHDFSSNCPSDCRIDKEPLRNVVQMAKSLDDELVTRDHVVRCDDKTYLMRELFPRNENDRLTPGEIQRLIRNKNKIGDEKCPCPYKFKPKTDTASEYSDSSYAQRSRRVVAELSRRIRGKRDKEQQKSKSEDSDSEYTTLSGDVSVTQLDGDVTEVKLPSIKVPDTFDGNLRFSVNVKLNEKNRKPINILNEFEMVNRQIRRIFVDGEEFVRKRFNVSALALASAGGHVEVVNFLISLKPTCVKDDESRKDEAERSLQTSARPIPKIEEDLTPTALIAAAAHSQVATAEVLEARGANVNHVLPGEIGLTALHVAAICGTVQIVQFLLTKRAIPSQLGGNSFEKWLKFVKDYNAVQILRQLLQGKSLRDKMNDKSITEILDENELPLLIKYRMNLLLNDKVEDITALMYAVASGNQNAVVECCKPVPDVLLPEKAVSEDFKIRYFHKEINAQEPSYGLTALMMTVVARDFEMFRTILDAGADPHIRTKAPNEKRRLSALTLAQKLGFTEVIIYYFNKNFGNHSNSSARSSRDQFIRSTKDSFKNTKEGLRAIFNKISQFEEEPAAKERGPSRADFELLKHSAGVDWSKPLPFLDTQQLYYSHTPCTRPIEPIGHDGNVQLCVNLVKNITENYPLIQPLLLGVPFDADYSAFENYSNSGQNTAEPHSVDLTAEQMVQKFSQYNAFNLSTASDRMFHHRRIEQRRNSDIRTFSASDNPYGVIGNTLSTDRISYDSEPRSVARRSPVLQIPPPKSVHRLQNPQSAPTMRKQLQIQARHSANGIISNQLRLRQRPPQISLSRNGFSARPSMDVIRKELQNHGINYVDRFTDQEIDAKTFMELSRRELSSIADNEADADNIHNVILSLRARYNLQPNTP